MCQLFANVQMPQPRSRSWAVRLVVLAYGAFCVIILSSYTANLAAFLTASQLSEQHGLADSKPL